MLLDKSLYISTIEQPRGDSDTYFDSIESTSDIQSFNAKYHTSFEKEVPHYFCGDCIHFKFNEPCKRIDHKNVKFAIPWFSSDEQHQRCGIICSAFETKNYYPYSNFEEYWQDYVKEWLPYSNTNILVYFTLNNDKSIRYGVPLMDYINGTMIENGKLKAIERMYYKRTKDKSSFGYKLVREPLDGGVIINEL